MRTENTIPIIDRRKRNVTRYIHNAVDALFKRAIRAKELELETPFDMPLKEFRTLVSRRIDVQFQPSINDINLLCIKETIDNDAI